MTAMNVERGASDDRSDRGMIAERLTSEPFYSWEGRRPAARTAAAPRESESKFPPEAGGSCGLLGVCVCVCGGGGGCPGRGMVAHGRGSARRICNGIAGRGKRMSENGEREGPRQRESSDRERETEGEWQREGKSDREGMP